MVLAYTALCTERLTRDFQHDTMGQISVERLARSPHLTRATHQEPESMIGLLRGLPPLWTPPSRPSALRWDMLGPAPRRTAIEPNTLFGLVIVLLVLLQPNFGTHLDGGPLIRFE